MEFVLRLGVIKSEEKKQMTGAEKQKLFPTDIGTLVNDFLCEHFKDILDYNFTANVESEFDIIAEGKMKRVQMLKEFYGPFHKEVENTIKTAEKQTADRELGKDPNTGKLVVARIGRFGPMVQVGTAQDEDKPKFASLKPGQTIETLTLEDALGLFALPRIAGKYQGEPITVAVGKFGPYLKYKTLFVSIPKTLDPYTITMEEIIPLVEKKIDTEKNKYINTFDNKGVKIEVLNGLYGAYIKSEGNNYKIPKGGKDATDLTLKDCLEIIASGPNKGKANKPATKAEKKAVPAKKPATSGKKPAAKKSAVKKVAKKK